MKLIDLLERIQQETIRDLKRETLATIRLQLAGGAHMLTVLIELISAVWPDTELSPDEERNGD